MKAHALVNDLAESYRTLKLVRRYFQKFGGPDALTKIVDDLIERIETNECIKPKRGIE